ncbi:MAG TPA: hypothetical protein VFH71_10600 [Rhodanobacteraceae bacterium]|nr:hypothetical protein [Rhodanobacteraceae bacterium]
MAARRFRLSSFALALAGIALAAPLATFAATTSSNFNGDLQWRLIGPFRGGWGTMAQGIPDQPNVYYFSSAGGGVWKTIDAGRTWQSLGDDLPASAMGAIAIAPSNPDVIYLGSGQVAARWDIQSGNGVYKSTDGGKSWHSAGLQATKYIGKILVDPNDPNTVLVGALGHYFGPNHQRGVFRSTDGGKTWQQTLYINDDTGVVDLARDPQNANVIYAAAWQVRNYPWLSYFQPNAGPGSGLYKSTDDGKTWTRISGNGWPTAQLARVGIAAASGNRVYAVVDAATTGSGNVPHAASEDQGGLYRSDDGGAHWQRVSSESWLENDYFSRITVDPHNPDVIYSAGQSIRESRDGGKTWDIIKGAPGGDDYHYVWLNPQHPDHMITASDQGVVITVDGGKTWSSWYNQPTGQFYHLATGNRFPYWVYSGQQDSGTVGIASRSDFGALSFRDWHPVGGDERDYDVPDPIDPTIVYGTGLGGRISRFDAITGQVANVSPWPVMSYGAKPTTTKYRYGWITPLVATRNHDNKSVLYFGAQVLFRSTDRGDHWAVISPDLTGQQQGAKNCENVVIANARACGYGVIYSIAVSPRDDNEIWTGSDSGVIENTRDGGAHWSDVTPKGIAPMTKISSLDVSALQPGTAYAAADNHRQDDFAPHVWRTHDFGKTWQQVDNGLPAGHYVSVVRADPVRAGLLYAGTDAGAFVSFDDGDHWQPLQLNLPTVWVRDLLVHDNDLIAATQGRAIWILDDLSPLRQWNANIASQPLHLFKPADALRVHANNNKDTPLPPETPLGKNPPNGAIIDYSLGANTHGPVTIDILDASGRLVRHYASDAKPEAADAERYFDADWLKPEPMPSAAPGLHRFVWNLRYPRPRAASYDYSIAAVFGEDTPTSPQGAFVLPGRYTVVLKADGHEQRQPLTVKMDPRVHTSMADLQAALAFSQSVGTSLDKAYVGYAQQKSVKQQLEALARQLGNQSSRKNLLDEVQALEDKLQGNEDAKLDETTSFGALSGQLATLESDAESADTAPTAAQREVLTSANARLQTANQQWEALQSGDLAKLNADLKAAGMQVVSVPPPDKLDAGEPDEGKDLP